MAYWSNSQVSYSKVKGLENILEKLTAFEKVLPKLNGRGGGNPIRPD